MANNRETAAVGVASLLVIISYFVVLGLTASEVVVAAGLGGSTYGVVLFAVMIAVELGLLFVLELPPPFMLLFSIPLLIGYIALKGVADSAALKKFFKQLEDGLRTPRLPIPRL